MADGSGAVGKWLSGLKLEAYTEAFREHGFDTMESLEGVSSEDLDRMGVSLQGHRNRILKHLPRAPADEESTSAPSAGAGGDDFGLNDILGDLNSMLGDLGGPSSEGAAAAAAAPSSSAAAASGDGVEASASSASILADTQDADLDNILSDLCSFGEEEPKEAVEQRFPAVTPHPRLLEEQQAGGESTPSESSARSAEHAIPAGSVRLRKKAAPDISQVREQLTDFSKRMSASGKISQQDLDNLMKEEKIRIAMERLASAQLEKVIIKVFMQDQTSKTVAISLPETAFEVCRKLVVKNRMEDDPNWKLVEVCPSLKLERHLEDHESVGEAYNAWPPYSDYRFEMRQDPDKYALFVRPDKYFPSQFFEDLADTAQSSSRVERAKRVLLQEYFSTSKRLPDVKGYIHDREAPKKWKKKFFVLRASGIYYSTKGESEASSDLRALIKFDEYIMCFGLDFKASFKAPTDLCLCFRPNVRKRALEQSDVRAVCCADEASFNSLLAGVRLAMHGAKLKDGYDETLRKFDALVQMGASKPETKDALVNKDLHKAPVEQVNRHLVRQWQAQRAGSTPGISAATGVEFDDLSDPMANASANPDAAGLADCSWYHGAISRQEADSLFGRMNYITGCFLVRASTSHPGDFVLSVCFGGQPHHFHVIQLGDGETKKFGIDEQQQFDSVQDLVRHFKSNSDKLPTPLVAEVPRQRK